MAKRYSRRNGRRSWVLAINAGDYDAIDHQLSSADREFNDKRELMVKIGDKEYSTYADVAGELMVLLMLDPVDGAVIDDLEDWYPHNQGSAGR